MRALKHGLDHLAGCVVAPNIAVFMSKADPRVWPAFQLQAHYLQAIRLEAFTSLSHTFLSHKPRVNNTDFVGLVWKLNEIMHVKCFSQWLEQSKHSINGSFCDNL